MSHTENKTVRQESPSNPMDIKRVLEQLSQKLTDTDFSALLNSLNSTALVSMTDEKGNIVYANEKFVEISKYSLPELIGQNHRILKSGHQRDTLFADLWQNISSGKIWRGEIKNRAKDGSYYWVDTSIAPVLGKDGKPERYISVRFLITDKKEAEERLTSIINSADNAIITKDLNGNILSWNNGAEKMYGYAAEEVIGKDIGILAPAGLREEIRFILGRIKKGERVPQFETKRRKKNGTMIDISLSISPIMSSAGIVVGASTIANDITEKKVKEQTLVGLLTALDKTALVSMTDHKGNILYANPKFVEISQYSLPELLGQNHSILKSGHHSQELFKDLWQTISGGKVWRGEIKNKAKDGTYYWVDTSIAPILGQNGAPEKYISVRFLITEKKEIEQKIDEYLNKLEAANKDLESFSYSVSHDLRAPLRSIDGFSQILLEDYNSKLDDDGKHLIDVIRKSTEHMGRLIDELLAFSRVGRQEIKKELIDMEEMVSAVFYELKNANPGRDIELNLPKLPQALGDSILVRQVWVNLLSNAIKFTRPRKAAIIDILGSKTNDEALYAVKDNGVGFDPQYADKLFGVFQRLHDAKTFEGTGIGLAIVKKIITKHGGKVWADSQLDKGATFSFSLPLISQKS